MLLEVCMCSETSPNTSSNVWVEGESARRSQRNFGPIREAGLLHMSRNTTEDIDFLCNCDRWHCEVVTHILQQPRPDGSSTRDFGRFSIPDVASHVKPALKVPPEALTMGENGSPLVDSDRCFGCGVCATGCPKAPSQWKPSRIFRFRPEQQKSWRSAEKQCWRLKRAWSCFLLRPEEARAKDNGKQRFLSQPGALPGAARVGVQPDV